MAGQEGIRVVVVPVSVQQHGWESRPTVVAWPGEEGAWAQDLLEGSAFSTAQGLLAGLLPMSAQLLDPARLTPQPVTFMEGSQGWEQGLTLLYTVAVPMALSDPETEHGDQWVALVRPEPTAKEARRKGRDMLADLPYVFEIVDYWRRVLDETAGGLLFLSRYWTKPQLRDIYTAVWGYEQDAAGFTAWAFGGRRSGGAFSKVGHRLGHPDITDELAEALADAAAAVDDPDAKAEGRSDRQTAARTAGSMAAWTALAQTLRSPKAVGLRLGGLPATVLPAAAVAAAAGMVAYQASARGGQPSWYTTTTSDPNRYRLKSVYKPRPGWLDLG